MANNKCKENKQNLTGIYDHLGNEQQGDFSLQITMLENHT